MIRINYPEQKPAIRTQQGKEQVFCIVRRKWILLTPEEWVRQNILLYMHVVMLYPLSLIAVEKQIQLGELKKRFDIVVFRHEVPYILVECKEMNVPVSIKTLEQVLRYNIELQAACFFLTNGTHCFGFAKKGNEVLELSAFPGFDEET